MDYKLRDGNTAKVKLTAGRIWDFNCPVDKAQVFLWDADVYELAARGAPSGKFTIIFQAKLTGKDIRVTLGDNRNLGIDEARDEARRMNKDGAPLPWVLSSPTAANGRLQEPRLQLDKAHGGRHSQGGNSRLAPHVQEHGGMGGSAGRSHRATDGAQAKRHCRKALHKPPTRPAARLARQD